MEIIILGSGTYEPEAERHCSGYLVKAGGQNIVLDFGRGVLDQLIKSGVGYYDIDHIFITHTHADHCSELGSFLHIALHEPEVARRRKREATIYGPKGIKEAMNHMFRAFSLDPERPRYKVHIRELGKGEAVKGRGWAVTGYPSSHGIPGLCYRVESGGRVLAYSGDTRDCQGLREACRDADLAVIEASWPSEVQSEDHMTGEEAGKLAQESGVKKLVLTHVAPCYLEKSSPAGDAGKFYKGRILLAKDLMRIKI